MQKPHYFTDIKGLEGLYAINKQGKVYSYPKYKGTGQFLKPSLSRENGYLTVAFYDTKKKRYQTRSIHRLVAETFILNPENKPQVNHINGIKTDNRSVNLEWCTPQENSTHASLHRLNTRGKRSLTWKQIQEIRAARRIMPTVRQLSIKYKVSMTTISRVCRQDGYKYE